MADLRERLRLVSDDDGHEYLIQASRRREWAAWVDSEEAMDGDVPPRWATRLDMHHSNYTFTGWEEDRGYD